MNSKQNPGTMAMVGAISGGVGFVAFLVMMVVGGAGFSAALVLAILLVTVVAVFLLFAFHERPTRPVRFGSDGEAHAPAAAHQAPAGKVAAAAETAAEAGAKPELLAKPRGGKGDDLKQIKGVGPKLESLLNEMGVWHFEQIATWSADEVAWVDENVEGFKGRVTRDDWVAQAKTLAAGGSTAFAEKVKDGDVY